MINDATRPKFLRSKSMKTKQVSFLALLGLTALQVPVPLLAQAAPAMQAAQPSVTGLQCMAVSNARRTSFVIAVPTSRTNSLRSRGYVGVPCDGRENNQAQYRKSVCDLAAKLSDQMKALFTASHKVSPDELCEMASSQDAK